MTKKYIFIIDTDRYSGNFEREMTAYCTGAIGDCQVGDHLATLFEYDCPEGKNITEKTLQVIDEEGNGCYRPAAIWPTPHRYNDGRGGHFDGEMDDNRWPAYESVAMFFKEPLEQSEIDILKQRAIEFGAGSVSGRMRDVFNIKVTGFRMIIEETVVTETEVSV